MRKELEKLSKEIRQLIFKTAYSAQRGHIAPALSCVEIINILYFGGILRYDHTNPMNPNRDRFILSKGHGCLTLYSVLAKAGFFRRDLLSDFCKKDALLGGLASIDIPGVEATTGTLGHGLSFAAGMALAAKLNKEDYQVYALLGDGECQEGSIWEAALFAAQYELDNLTIIIDHNKLQIMDSIDKIIGISPFGAKWKAFNCNVVEIDGHNLEELNSALTEDHNNKKPQVIIAHTTKGKGISFMENEPLWHARFPNEDEMEIALRDLELSRKELEII